MEVALEWDNVHLFSSFFQTQHWLTRSIYFFIQLHAPNHGFFFFLQSPNNKCIYDILYKAFHTSLGGHQDNMKH